MMIFNTRLAQDISGIFALTRSELILQFILPVINQMECIQLPDNQFNYWREILSNHIRGGNKTKNVWKHPRIDKYFILLLIQIGISYPNTTTRR